MFRKKGVDIFNTVLAQRPFDAATKKNCWPCSGCTLLPPDFFLKAASRHVF
jgi:hypothetical protein